MTRVLSIVVALLAFCAVLSAGVAYAAPLRAIAGDVAVDADTCVVAASKATASAGRFCIKHHTQGLPCTPVPLILPTAAALPLATMTELPRTVLASHRLDPAWSRLFRPPRHTLA